MTRWSFYMKDKLHHDLILACNFTKNELVRYRCFKDIIKILRTGKKGKYGETETK